MALSGFKLFHLKPNGPMNGFLQLHGSDAETGFGCLKITQGQLLQQVLQPDLSALIF